MLKFDVSRITSRHVFCFAFKVLPSSSERCKIVSMRYFKIFPIFGIIAFILSIFAVTNAYATPPRSAQLSDIPIALNKTHLFLFRSISDNHGSHYISDTQRFLISQNLKTGLVDNHWPLGSIYVNSIDECKIDCVKSDMSGAVNPIDILAANNTFPLVQLPFVTWHGDDQFPSFLVSHYLSEKGLLKKAKSGIKIVLSKPKLLERIAASLNPTMDIMPKIGLQKNDPFEFNSDSYSKELIGCITNAVASNLLHRTLFNLSCESEEFLGQYSIYFTIEIPSVYK